MLPFPMVLGRHPVLAAQTSPRNLCALCVSALSFSGSSHYILSTRNRRSLSPCPATLTSRRQTIEKSATLSLVLATLTRLANHNPFVCHSCKKTPGVGYAPQTTFPYRVHPLLHTRTNPRNPFLLMELLHDLRIPGGWGRSRQFDLAVRPAKTASGRSAPAESFFAPPPSDGALSPAFAPGMPISIARRTALIGASSFNTTVLPLASMPNSFHIAGRSTCTGLSFHSEYSFSKTSNPTAWSPILNVFSISQSWRMSPPASRIPRSASSNPFLFLVCFRISTSATKQKSAPPQYVLPQVCVWSSPSSPACGSPLGISRTRSLHICSAVQCPARMRAIGSTYTEMPSSIQWCSSPIIEGNAR